MTFESFTALMKISVFWDMMLCSLTFTNILEVHAASISALKMERNIFRQNVYKHLQTM
jgi:hypothetical protein